MDFLYVCVFGKWLGELGELGEASYGNKYLIESIIIFFLVGPHVGYCLFHGGQIHGGQV
jgi:hypothetical protein